MQVLLGEELRRDPEQSRVLTDVAEGRPCGLLHHVAELPGQRDVAAAARHECGLDEQDVTADFCPGHACRDARS